MSKNLMHFFAWHITYICTQTHLISIITDDVNNKGPIFNQDTLLPIMIMENVKSGYFVRQVLANDPDLTAKLEFRIDYNASEGRNENGILVPNLNISEIFSIEKDKGDIEVIGNLISIVLIAGAGPVIVAVLAFNKGNL